MSQYKDILFLPVSGPRGASSRYRVFQFLPAIVDAGMTYAVHLPPEPAGRGIGRLIGAVRERRKIAELADMARAVFIQKRLLPESQLAPLARHQPMLFDFDDAIFTAPGGDRSRIAQRRVEGRLKAVLSGASLVVAGNGYLGDYARQFSDKVTCLPTVVDTTRYPAKQHADVKEIVIGWIGHSVNHPYLAGMTDVLQRVAKYFSIRLLVVSDRDLAIPGVHVENRRWSEATEVEDILRMDIGIMPMPDDPWSRGKCGFKAIQYMAAGIPVVCAAVGANIEIVRDGTDGLCAASSHRWIESLDQLCSSMALRQCMGLAARERAIERYSLKAATPAMLEAISRYCQA